MMKRFSLLIAIVAALSFVFVGCNSNSADSAGISAPSIGTASDLASSGGTAPGSNTAALALFTAACNALNTEVVANAPSSASSVKAFRTARATTPIDETINVNFTPKGGGTVAYTGTYTGSITMPDSGWSPSPNTSYNKVVAVILNATVNGTLTSVVVSDSSYSYTINGIAKNEMSETASINLVTGSTEGSSTATMDFALGIGIGTAVSIRRSDGVGAKFLITYGANYAKSNINVSTMSDSTFSTEMENYLTSQPATLKVYNDSNEIVFEMTLTADDAYAASILSHFGD